MQCVASENLGATATLAYEAVKNYFAPKDAILLFRFLHEFLDVPNFYHVLHFFSGEQLADFCLHIH